MFKHNFFFPTVNEQWQRHQEEVLGFIGNSELTLLGNGICDSPGYLAKYGIYTFMEHSSFLVVDFAVVHFAEPSVCTC